MTAGTPTPDSRDAAFAALCAADPAAGFEPNTPQLRAKVDALLVADAASTVDGTRLEGAPEIVDELALRRAQRNPQRRFTWVAAAAVAAIAVGGGGYWAGAAANRAPSPDFATAASIPELAEPDFAAADSLNLRTMPGVVGEMQQRESYGIGGAEGLTMVGDRAWGGWWGRNVFHDGGLPGERGTAAMFALDASDVGLEMLTRIGAAFGIEGEPRIDHGWMNIGPDDWSGPNAWLSPDGLASFGFNNPSIDPWACPQPMPVIDEEGRVQWPEVACPTPPPTTISPEQAIEQMQAIVVALGLDSAEFNFTVEQSDPSTRWVVGTRTIGGVDMGIQWSATITDDGIAWFNGSLANLVPHGDVPIISAAEAAARLNDPRFSPGTMIAWGTPDVIATPRGESEVQTAPVPPAPGTPIPWLVNNVQLVSANLNLAQQWLDSGATLLVPTWELSDAHGNTWSIIAVADEALNFSG